MSYENIIIGAGPAGLQLAYFFKKAGIEYLVLERNEIAGSFFDKYPHSGKLISINKKHTGTDIAEFNLRHDWNSLLSDENLLFTEYSDDYYPDSADLVNYLNDFADINKLNIQYGCSVLKIKKGGKDAKGYQLEVKEATKSTTYTCKKLIVATGMSKAALPDYEVNVKTPIKHYADYEKDYFKKPENLAKFNNKSVFIVGSGNSAFELANILTPHCSSIIVKGNKEMKKWAMQTHYAGDVRSVYHEFFDTFLLKSLNAFDHDRNDSNVKFLVDQDKETSQYIVSTLCSTECKIKHKYLRSNTGFDHVIFCTGWKFDTSIFDFDITLTSNGKYPAMYANYESVDNEELYFIGSLMHALDYKKSSGGFIHGFRYLIKYFVNINYTGQHDAVVFKENILENLTNYICKRFNLSSSMYQMYGQMGDVFYYEPSKKELTYIHNVGVNFLQSIIQPDILYFAITLEYGDTKVEKIAELGNRESSLGHESKARLLHPIIRVARKAANAPVPVIVDEIHFDEDLLARFVIKEQYYDKILRTLRMFLPYSK
jgi:thioredoxin reductase